MTRYATKHKGKKAHKMRDSTSGVKKSRWRRGKKAITVMRQRPGRKKVERCMKRKGKKDINKLQEENDGPRPKFNSKNEKKKNHHLSNNLDSTQSIFTILERIHTPLKRNDFSRRWRDERSLFHHPRDLNQVGSDIVPFGVDVHCGADPLVSERLATGFDERVSEGTKTAFGVGLSCGDGIGVVSDDGRKLAKKEQETRQSHTL